MKLTAVCSWKMSIHFKQFQEDPILPFTYEKKKFKKELKKSEGGCVAHPHWRPNPAWLWVRETLSMALPLCCFAAVSEGRLEGDIGTFTSSSWEGDRSWRTLWRALPTERLPFLILPDNLHLWWDWAAAGFFSDLQPASTGTKIMCCVCEKTL